MMKKSLFLMALCVPSCLFAQNPSSSTSLFKPYEKHWQLEFTGGANFDMPYSGSNPNAAMLSARPDIAPAFSARISHFFSKKIGWYGNLQFNFYKEKNEDKNDPFFEIFEKLVNKVFAGITTWHPSFDVGVLYRIENNKFRLYPSAGIGYNMHLRESSSGKAKVSEGVKRETRFEQNPGYLSLSLGLTANYYVSKRSFFVLKAGFQQPLQNTTVHKTLYEDGIEKENRYYETSTAGRSFTASIGYGFAFGRRK